MRLKNRNIDNSIASSFSICRLENPYKYGDISVALEELYQLLKFDSHDAKVLETLAEIYFKLGDYEQSAVFYFEIINNNANDLKIILSLSISLIEAGKLEEGYNILEDLVTDDNNELIMLLYAKGIYNKLLKKSNHAYDYLYQALVKAESIDWREFEIRTRIKIAEIALQKQNSLEVIKLLELLKKDDIEKISIDFYYGYRLLSEAYKKTGNHEQSMEMLIKYLHYQQEYFSNDTIRKAEDLKNSFNQSKQEVAKNKVIDKSLQWIVYDQLTMLTETSIRLPLNILSMNLESILIEEENNPGFVQESVSARLHDMSDSLTFINMIMQRSEFLNSRKKDENKNVTNDMSVVITQVIEFLKPLYSNHDISLIYEDNNSIIVNNIENLKYIFISLIIVTIKLLKRYCADNKEVRVFTEKKSDNSICLMIIYRCKEIFNVLKKGLQNNCDKEVLDKRDCSSDIDILKHLLIRSNADFRFENDDENYNLAITLQDGCE